MASFSLEIEQRRIREQGVLPDQIQKSLEDEIRSFLAERTESLNPFTLKVSEDRVEARGFEHRGDLNNSYKKSVEEAHSEGIAERFQLENDGYKKAKEYFTKLPLYSTVLLFSPPPDFKIDGYADFSQAYFYHILPSEEEPENKRKRTIKALSFIHRFTKDEQASILNRINNDHSVSPTESSILLSPAGVHGLENSTKSFKTIWQELEKEYGEKKRDFKLLPYEIAEQLLLDGEEAWKNRNRSLSVMVSEVAKLMANNTKEEKLHEKWAIMLNLADIELLHKDITSEVPRDRVASSVYITPSDNVMIFDMYRYLNKEPRKASTSCPPAGGKSKNGFGLENPLAKLSSNSLVTTGKFQVENAKDDPNLCRCGNREPHFHCPGRIENGQPCNHPIIVGEGTEKCPKCGEDKKC